MLLRTDLSGVKNGIRPQLESAITDETTVLPVFADFVQFSSED